MKCPKCQVENTDTAEFCSHCASPLQASLTRTLETPIQAPASGVLFAGRYEIISELGRGGMGKVYRAEDKKINEEVALKLIRPEIASDKTTLQRFSNELKLARKISHRNVCRMYELMEDRGIHFITMEFVPGQDLKGLLRQTGPLKAARSVPIARQICEGLAEAHRLGVVHRDLKPGNIMIDHDDNAKIMDFGIARSVYAKGVTAEGLVIGTPEYMSPEQLEGKEPDPRSDIYSLGVILYEMVTGRVPFGGDSALSIALQHKTEFPLSPQEFAPDLPPDLSAVVLRCLAKDREERYQSAEELLRTLDDVQGGVGIAPATGKTQIPSFLIEEEPFREKLPVFVARETELEWLGKALDSVLLGKGRVVFLTGEAGTGKTALLQEFSRRSQDAYPDLIVANGKCNAHTGIGDPYLPFIEIMALLSGDVEAKRSAGTISREHATRLWNLIPFTAKTLLENGQDLLNTLVPGAPLVARSEVASAGVSAWLASLKKLVERKSSLPADSTLQQSHLFEQYTRVLQALSGKIPLLLIVDDLQWTDAGSASLLFHLGRRIAGSRILIVGAFRPAEVAFGRGEERHPLGSILLEFKRDLGEIEMEVGKAEGRRFVDDFIDSEPNRLTETFRQALYNQTKGHPLFTVELLRNMQERGALVKDKIGCWVEGPELDWDTLPARVDAVIEERINRLNEKLRELLTIASIEGEEFSAEVIARVQEAEVHGLIRLLSRELDKRHHLVSAKGIRQLERQRLSVYLFQHILFQKYLYNSLDKVERAHLHEQVGNILEALYGEQTEDVAIQLARHFLEAGIVPKAVEYLHKAGTRAVRLSASDEAIGHFKKALELLRRLPETAERDQQELVLQLALAVPLQAARGFGAPELGRSVVRARELCDRMGDTPQRFTALVQLSTYYATKAQYRTALTFQDQITQIAEQSKDPMLEAVSYYAPVWPLLNVGELVPTIEHVKHMMTCYDPEKHGFMAYLFGYDLGVLSLGFGSWAQWILGYPDQALHQLNQAMSIARKLGHPHTLAFIAAWSQRTALVPEGFPVDR